MTRRDNTGTPVMLDECGHEVIDFETLWDELLAPDSVERRDAYRQYNAQHRNVFSRVLRWFKK